MEKYFNNLISRINYFYKVATLKVPTMFLDEIFNWVKDTYQIGLLQLELETEYLKDYKKSNQTLINDLTDKISNAGGELTGSMGYESLTFKKIFTIPLADMPYINNITDELLNYRAEYFRKQKPTIYSNIKNNIKRLSRLKNKKINKDTLEYETQQKLEEVESKFNSYQVQLTHVKKIAIEVKVLYRSNIKINANFNSSVVKFIDSETLYIGSINLDINTDNNSRKNQYNLFMHTLRARRYSENNFILFLKNVLEHELRHGIQSFISEMKSKKFLFEEKALYNITGIGPKGTEEKYHATSGISKEPIDVFDIYNTPTQSKTLERGKELAHDVLNDGGQSGPKYSVISHEYKDIEYQTRLSDSINTFNAIKEYAPQNTWLMIAKAITAIIKPNELLSYISDLKNKSELDNDVFDQIVEMIDYKVIPNESFSVWKAKVPNKYNAALKTFFKKVQI